MARDPYLHFRVEARELLDQLGQGALELDKGIAAPEVVARMLRFAHTLKGAARVVKQREIADRAHAIEDALDPFRESGVVPPEGVDATLKALDTIASQLAALALPSQPQPPQQPQLQPTATGQTQTQAVGDGALEAAPTAAPAARAEPVEAVRANVDEMSELLEGLAEAGVQLGELRRGSEALERGRRLAQVLEDHLAAPRADRLGGAHSKLPSMITELRSLLETVQRSFSDGIEQVDRELRQVHETAERLRLLPASYMFVSLERTLRDAAQALGKRIAFVTRGGNVRLDAKVFGTVQNALVQAVRNAVAHGIEMPAERQAAGKPGEGRVWLEVRRRGHRVVFVCRDDGRGVDLEAVRRALQRKGARPADGAHLTADEVLKGLLDGGISTSGTVTELAGRGIGMDVVREAARGLRGEIRLRTDPGLGTALEIDVPVTLAAVDALLVENGGRTSAIPLESIRGTIRVANEDLIHSAQGASILFEGNVIPFAPLGRALREVSRTTLGTRAWSAVIIQGSRTVQGSRVGEGVHALAAVGVERLRGTQNLVLRPLPEFTPADALVAGASLNAEGDPQLVLDPDGLVERVCRGEGGSAPAAPSRLPILVIDDSLTTRMLEQSILESAGYEVTLAASAEEGLERARQRRYALFLVDVEMPGIDGFTFIERTRADPELRETPAILVTSRNAPEDRERGRRVGARAYIVKGEFDQTELLENIRLLVGAS